MKESIISVGIDIGTSTTQLIFSRITLQNTASISSVPRIQIIDKEVIYKSNIYFTPLLTESIIDKEKARELVVREYERAGVKAEDVSVGAVIITGETARKENAKDVLHMLSDLGGDFVVATAGPDLEGIIAGKGANAQSISKEKKCIVANLDMGGGTTNIAVFKNGDVIDTSCLDVGGRLIKLDEDMRIKYISPRLKNTLDYLGTHISIGEKLNVSQINHITLFMIRALEEALGLRDETEVLKEFITDHTFRKKYPIDYVTFSGGVADFIYGEDNDDLFKYGDIGIILGRNIKNSNISQNLKVIKGVETIRATVIGAGAHTTDISGSTINFNEELLPLKNIPVVKISDNEIPNMRKEIKEKLGWFYLNNEIDNVALGIAGSNNLSFQEIHELAKEIIGGMDEIIKKNLPLIIVVERDMAKVLGQTMRNYLGSYEKLVCIDSVRVENGDYIDIGKSLANGKVLPVVIKTLLFGY